MPDDFVPATAPSRLVLLQNGHAIELNFNNGAVLEQLDAPFEGPSDVTSNRDDLRARLIAGKSASRRAQLVFD